MGWKDMITKMSEQQDTIETLIRYLQGEVLINSKRIEALKIMMDQQITTQSRSADRMADRMIEMAMVNRGDTLAAASHRRTLDENPAEEPDLWQDNPETQWPPPGCEAVNMP